MARQSKGLKLEKYPKLVIHREVDDFFGSFGNVAYYSDGSVVMWMDKAIKFEKGGTLHGQLAPIPPEIKATGVKELKEAFREATGSDSSVQKEEYRKWLQNLILKR